MGLYGNIISHIPRSHFDIVKTVANQAMLNSIINEINDGEYVLVDYNQGSFNSNLSADHNINYHNTVWQRGFKTTSWMAPGGTTLWDVPEEEELVPPTPMFFAIARLHSFLAEKPTDDDDRGAPATLAQAINHANEYTLVPVTTNQIPEIIAEPKEFNHFGTAEVTVPDNYPQSGTVTIISPNEAIQTESHKHSIETVLPLYGTTSYSYLTH